MFISAFQNVWNRDVSIISLTELGGWSDIKMVLRYAHLSSEKLQGAAENIVAKSLHKNMLVINQ